MRKLLEGLGTFIKTQETITGKDYECLDEAIAYIEKQMRYTMPTDSEKVKYLNYIKEHLFDTKIDALGDTAYRYLGTWGMGNYILDDAHGQPLLFKAIDGLIRKYTSSGERDYTNEFARPSNIKSLKEGKKSGSDGNDINEEELKKYFPAKYKGAANSPNLFKELTSLLKKPNRGNKDMARIALMIYESPKIIGKPQTFREWYKAFCDIVCYKANDGYKPCNLKATETLKKEFGYLL